MQGPRHTFRLFRRQKGAALLLFALVFLIAGISLFFSRAGEIGPAARDAISQDALEKARTALVGYAATYRDTHPGEMFGYLPCPDTNNDGEFNIAPPAIADDCGAAGDVVVGRFPYKTLGMPPLLDASGECLWYAVGNFKNNPKNDTLGTPEPMNWDTPGHFIVRDLDIKDLATPQQTDGGAAAVIFAPGPPLAGQSRPSPLAGNPCSGNAANSAAAVAAYLEGAYATPAATSLATPYAITAGRTTSSTNNDRVVWVTPAEIMSRRVKLRQDFQAGINAMLNQTQACLQTTFPNPTAIPGITPVDKRAGRVPAACATALPSGTYEANFQDQLIYASCLAVPSRCITLGTSTCDGVLLFSGERAAGQNRVTSADKNIAANYLEGINATALTTPFTGLVFAGNGTFGTSSPAAASADVAVCLVQNLSFANDITRLTAVTPTVAGQQFASIDTSAKTLTLGSATTTATPGDLGAVDLYGCSWFSDSRNFGNGLRAYFIADFQVIGEGMTFTLADAVANPNVDRCGSAGQALGYSGKGSLVASGIRSPKIALEFDTRSNPGYDESLTEPLTGRKDDLMTVNPHVAFVYWGNSQANLAQAVAQPTWDDNVHGKGGGLSASGKLEPVNSTAAASYKKMKGAGAGGIDKYVVRLDIKRTRDAVNSKSVYELQAWIFALNGEACYATAAGAGIADLSDDFENSIFWSASCKTPITDTITIYDEGGSEAFQTFRVGFTNGQSISGQRIVISNFALSARP